MKIQELRNLLKTADRELLEKAFAESYKQFTKNQKAEVDQIISNVLEAKDIKVTKQKESLDFKDLEQQITQLISVENENYEKSAKLLTDLYHLLCEACYYYLFSTDDPFRSIGWKQSDLFHNVVRKTLGLGYSREKIAALLLDAASGGLSRESLYILQERVLLAELKTSDVKYMAIEEARKLIEERKKKLKGLKKYNDQRYSLSEEVNNLCEMILMIAIKLAEPASGIEYYFPNCERTDKEIILYCALDIVDWEENDELWMQVYEYGFGKKIVPRDSLIKKYNKLKSGSV